MGRIRTLTALLGALAISSGLATGASPPKAAATDTAPSTNFVEGTFAAEPAEIEEWAAHGGSHTVIQLVWDRAQPQAGGPVRLRHGGENGAPLVAQLRAARRAGLKTIFEIAIQYPPDWVRADVPKFRDQFGHEHSAPGQPGADIRDWVWSTRGRRAVGELTRKVLRRLGERARLIDAIRLGGGHYNEMQYPAAAPGAEQSFWGYSDAALGSTDSARNQIPPPEPGYVYGTGTPAQDQAWSEWYLDSLGNFVSWWIKRIRAGGFERRIYVMHPGFGLRDDWLPDSAAFRSELARGIDFGAQLDAYRGLEKVRPWSTWIDGRERWYEEAPEIDSTKAAWRKLLEEARERDMARGIVGENTGGGSMDVIDRVQEPLAEGYRGIFWFDYDWLAADDGRMLEAVTAQR